MNTDYLVVGAGATGLAFTDTLVREADVRDVKAAVERYVTHVGTAIERLNQLEGDGRLTARTV